MRRTDLFEPGTTYILDQSAFQLLNNAGLHRAEKRGLSTAGILVLRESKTGKTDVIFVVSVCYSGFAFNVNEL